MTVIYYEDKKCCNHQIAILPQNEMMKYWAFLERPLTVLEIHLCDMQFGRWYTNTGIFIFLKTNI